MPRGVFAPDVDVDLIMSPTMLVFSSSNVLLPGRKSPTAATIVVDQLSGKITEIHERIVPQSEFPDIADSNWIDAGDDWILPGLVE